jgi:hypothetical protein
MNMQRIKKFAFALVLTLGFVVVPGLSSLSAAQAQGWGYGRDRWEDRRDDRWDRRNDRYDDRYGRNGSYRDEERGFRDGLNRGREDARDRRRADPNNSSHYRDGNRAYREGFRRGYTQGYREYGGRGWGGWRW